MTVAETKSQELLSRMVSSRVLPEAAELAAARRMRVVGSLFELHARILEGRRRVGRWRRRIAWLALAAMPTLAVGGGWYVHALRAGATSLAQPSPGPLRLNVVEGTVRVSHGGRSEEVAAPESLRLGSCEDLFTLGDARAALVLASGTRVEALAATRLGVNAFTEARGTTETVDLNTGQVEVAAPKLGQDRFLSVRTPDTTVEVRGTKFTVAVQKAQPTTITRVVVTEGRVLVRHDGVEIFLSAGSSWSSAENGVGSAAGAGTSSAVEPRWATGAPREAAPERASSEGAKATAAKAANLQPSPPESSSAQTVGSLGGQIRLFKRAMQARREGDDTRALTLLNQLLVSHPETPLAQEARVERFRALQRMGQSEASTREARRYLADYPGGFATGEARGLALGRASSGSNR